MKMLIRTLLILLLTAAMPALAFAEPVAYLSLRSEPGDFVGGGQSVDLMYRSPQDLIRAGVWRRFADGSPSLVAFDAWAPNAYATLLFGTHELGIPLQPGTYTDAQRAPFAEPGHAGLDVSFQHRGSNTLWGSFTILEATFMRDDAGALQVRTFDALFSQRSEYQAPVLSGHFRYNAAGDDLAPVPEPGTMLLLGSGVAALMVRYRRRGGTAAQG